jgi:hypothetical protein
LSTSRIGAPGRVVVLLQLLEQRRLGDGHPDPQADGDQRATEQERDPQAPRLEGGVGQGGRHDPEDTGGQQVAGVDADLGQLAFQPRRLGSPCSSDISTAPPHSPPSPEALDEAEHDQQDGRGHADGRVGRQQADEEGGDAHHQQGHHQHGLAADLVAEVAEDDPADGPGDEPGGRGRKASSVPVSGSASGKNSLLKTGAAAEPWRKKSYHSREVPIRLATTTLRVDWGWDAWSALMVGSCSRRQGGLGFVAAGAGGEPGGPGGAGDGRGLGRGASRSG